MMYFTRLLKSRTIYRSLFALSLGCSLVLSSSGCVESPKAVGNVVQQSKPQEWQRPKFQEWQINGISAALEEDPSWINMALFPMAFYDGRDLKSSKKLEAIAQKLSIILRDKKKDSSVRSSAAHILMNLGDAGQPFKQEIDTMLKDKTISLYKFPKPEIPVDVAVPPQSSISAIGNILKDKTKSACARSQATRQLISWGESGKAFIPDIIDFIQDQTPDVPQDASRDPVVPNCDADRGNLAINLPKFGASLNPYLPDLRKILNDKAKPSRVRGMAASAIASLGDSAKVTVPDMVTIIRDKAQGIEVRSRVSRALLSFGDGKSMGNAHNPFIQDIFNVLKDGPKNMNNTEIDRLGMSLYTRIGLVSQLEFQQALPFLDMAEFEGKESAELWRFSAYVESGGNEEIKNLLKWVGKPKLASTPTQLNYKDAVKTLTLFAKAWEFSSNSPDLRRGLMPKIAIVTQMAQWQPRDKPLLTLHYNNLTRLDPPSAKVLQRAIARLDRQ